MVQLPTAKTMHTLRILVLKWNDATKSKSKSRTRLARSAEPGGKCGVYLQVHVQSRLNHLINATLPDPMDTTDGSAIYGHIRLGIRAGVRLRLSSVQLWWGQLPMAENVFVLKFLPKCNNATKSPSPGRAGFLYPISQYILNLTLKCSTSRTTQGRFRDLYTAEPPAYAAAAAVYIPSMIQLELPSFELQRQELGARMCVMDMAT